MLRRRNLDKRRLSLTHGDQMGLFGNELGVVVSREARWRYSHVAYCAAKFVSQLPLTMLYPPVVRDSAERALFSI